MDKLSKDLFLGGALTICQPVIGFRAGIDAVLLGAGIEAKRGQRVLELGCGVATAGICLIHRLTEIDYTGIELQSDYAALARDNLRENNLQGRIITADLRALPNELKHESFDHVFANPPYYRPEQGTLARDDGRATALSGETALEDWVALAYRRLKPKAYATFIQRIDRLPDLLGAMQQYFGSIEVYPLAPRHNRASHLFLMRGRKDGRAAFKMHSPLILHANNEHKADAPDYTDQVDAILRHGIALDWPRP